MDMVLTNDVGLVPRRQLEQGFEFLRQGRLAEARQISDALVGSYGANAEVLFLASEVRLEAGDPASALECISAAIQAAPGQWPLLLKKADNLIRLRRRSDACKVADEATALAGNNGHALREIGKIHARCGDPVNACRFYALALATKACDPQVFYELAAAQFYTGDIDAAEKNLGAYLEAAPSAGHALYLRSTLRRQVENRNHVEDLEQRLKRDFPSIAERAACLYALAKELEDLGQAARSFAVLSEAAALKRQTLDYDAATGRASIEAIAATWSTEVMQARTVGHEDPGAIFIVGMPRTGTTLVERMLGSHSKVASAGELLDFGQLLAAAAQKCMDAAPGKTLVEASLKVDFAELGRDYLASARQSAMDSQVFIDKMPVNYIYCGLINKALPNARIIHVVRDPMDTCYAIYKTLFNQAYFYSYDLDELADYYLTYAKSMRHWHAAMPGAILDVRYEDLVVDTEAQARRMLDWCGLDWEASVCMPSANETPARTASAAQVREPISDRSVQKWRNHAAALSPLKARLQAAGLIDAEGWPAASS